MEYNFFTSQQIDYKKWDDTLEKDPLAPVYVYSWYLDSVSDKWGAIISKDYKTVFPIAFRKKFGISYIYQPFFTRSFGLFGPKENLESFYTVLKGLIEKFRYWDFSIDGNDFPEILKANYSPRKFQMLDLNSTFSKLQNGYSANVRRSIRLAHADKLNIIAVTDVNHFTNEFKRNTSSRISAFGQNDYKKLAKLLVKCKENTETLHYAIQKDNHEIASAFFTKTGQRIIYIEGYSSPDGRRMRAMHLIFDAVIRDHAAQNLLLDFGGSNVPSIAHFFRSFGAVDQTYCNIKMNNLPLFLRWMKK